MDAIQPLQKLLEQFNTRISAIEAKIGLSTNQSQEIQKSSSSSTTPVKPSQTVMTEVPRSVEAYDEYIQIYLVPFLNACKKLGDDPIKYGNIVEKAFQYQRNFLLMASQCKKPPSSDLVGLLKNLQESIKEMNGLRDNRSEWSHHQNMLNEGIQSLGWLCVEPAPRPFIESYVGGSDFWGNKIRVQYKTTNPDQVEFVTTFRSLLTELMKYVKEHHTTGVVWNPQGGDVSKFSSSSVPSASSTTSAKNSTEKSGGMNSVFAGIRSIDQSSGKTSGLKTVTKDMQTWRKEYKGPNDAPAPAPTKVKKPTSQVTAPKINKPPICEQRNGNWFIENQTSNEPVIVKDLNMRQQVYVFNCHNSTILLEGKAKNIVFDSCKNSKLIFDSAVSAMEIVNCKKIQVQCKKVVPSISIDKTDGCLVYVSHEGKGVQIVSSKSSEMNVSFPSKEGSDDYIEIPIPEQFVHKITSENKISSDVSDLYSG